ncbi:hypothetical protein G9A89_011984 [Geosiphon pyriformis]|nr:hypothetical protein G9A89_011984 [Geosiphon pyriformis]
MKAKDFFGEITFLSSFSLKPVGLSADGSGLISAGLETHMNAKKNHLNNVYFRSAL